MSLNGLDEPTIQEAYQQSIAEAGGWFLLKYVSRDSVELHGKGKGGVHEARNAIAKYEEASPLYGLIVYRRRKILIKYIPESTSRLLQARTAVHFHDVVERYSPFENLLEIATADDLNDTSLAASFPLHTASPSTSSSRLQLHEISEDGEDTGPPKRPTSIRANTGSIFGTQRYKMERRVDQIMRSDSPARTPTPSIRFSTDGSSLSAPPGSPPTPKASSNSGRHPTMDFGLRHLNSSSEEKAQSDEVETEGVVGKDDKTSIAASADGEPTSETPSPSKAEVPVQEAAEKSAEVEADPGKSTVKTDATERSVQRNSISETRSLSERPKFDYDEPYDFSKFDALKPKVKLGPRPVAAGERAKASVATLPINHRPISKKQEQSRHRSQGPMNLPAPASAPTFVPPPVPETPEYSPRPVFKGGSIKSLPSFKSSTMKPDKARLMKAVELQKRKQRKSGTREPASDHAVETQAATEASENARTGSSQDEDRPQDLVKAIPPEQASDQRAASELAPWPRDDHLKEEDGQLQTKKPDSGILMEYQRSEQGGSAAGKNDSKVGEVHAQREPEALCSSTRLSETSGVSAFHEGADPEPSEDTKREKMDGPVSEPVQPKETEIDERLGPHAILESRSETVPVPDSNRNAPETSPTGIDEVGASEDQISPLADDADALSPSGTVSPVAEDMAAQSLRISHHNVTTAKKRRGIVAPIQVDESNDSLADDEFADEMQEATVHDAKPMTVAKSPIAEVYRRRPSAMSGGSTQSVRSNQDAHGHNVPSSMHVDRFYSSPDNLTPGAASLPTSRTPSFSASQGDSPNAERGDLIAGRKRNVSSGITKRIQALAEHSSRDPSPTNRPSPSAVPSPDPPNGTVGDRKASIRDQPRPRSSYFFRKKTEKYGPIAPLEATAGAPMSSTPVWNVQHNDVSDRNSVSVTARIVRPQSRNKTNALPEGELRHSDILVNHKRTTNSPKKAEEWQSVDTNVPVASPKSEVPLASQPPSSPTTTRPSGSSIRHLHSASRLSFGRHKASPVQEDVPQTPALPNTSSSNSIFSNDENAAPKEGSRTSRFFKRMSNIGGGSKRKSISQQSMISSVSVAGTDDARRVAAGKEQNDKPPAVVVGDLNIQFPDSLLWKRRWVKIDEAGYLIFSIPQAMDHQRGLSKRFHLSDFQAPYVPDLDRQELSHSILLDFSDGTTLQVACEDSSTHRQALQLLRTYHKVWQAS